MHLLSKWYNFLNRHRFKNIKLGIKRRNLYISLRFQFSGYSADPQYSSAVINTNVIVSHTGEVVWLSHGIFRSSCDINVEFFPFDEQRCALKWASWTYDGYQVSFIFYVLHFISYILYSVECKLSKFHICITEYPIFNRIGHCAAYQNFSS